MSEPKQIDLHWLACELDHDIKNHSEGLDRIRWNNRAMMLMLQRVQSLRATCKAALVDLVTVTALTGSQEAGEPTIAALREAIKE